MATGSESETRIAELTGIPLVTLKSHTRILKEEGLFARSRKGGGRYAGHVEPHHLVNLLIGLSANPITSSGNTVEVVRSLVPLEIDWEMPFLQGASLGEALDEYISSGASKYFLDMSIYRLSNGYPTVALDIRQGSGKDQIERKCIYVHKSYTDTAYTNSYTAYSPRYTFTVTDNLFRELANLWIDTLRYREQTQNAPLAGGALHDQDQNSIRGSHNDPEVRRESESLQPLSSNGPGPSKSRHRKDNHDYARPYGSAAAAE